jgi:RNA polymerase sigma-70 factor (ECF subfamily)
MVISLDSPRRAASIPSEFVSPTNPPASLAKTATKRTPEAVVRAQTSRTDAAIDAGLVTRFNGGDEAAFVEIVERHRGRVLSLAERCLRNTGDAEEIAQDTFIRAYRGLAQFRGEASLATWLHRIAMNLARNRYWHFFRRRRHLTMSMDCPLGTENSATLGDLVATDEADPARQATVDEFVGVVATCMQRLDASHREILTMRNDEHRTYEEIAQALGIHNGTVKSRIARARGSLRRLMSESYPAVATAPETTDWFGPARAAGLAA